MADIQRIVAARNIQILTHFTQLSNLDSILTQGLLTKSEIGRGAIRCDENDSLRLDQTDAVCSSISFPNYKMWYQLRMANPAVKWALVILNASVLWQRDCVFSVTNAAASNVTSVPLEMRRGALALAAMFQNYGEKDRGTLNIPDHFTTNPQAEVLIMNGVPRQYIRAVVFNDSATKAYYATKYPNLDCRTIPSFWSPRSDWGHWQKV